MSPTELVRHAKAIGLQGLSITDHDTVDAYAEAIPVAREVGILMGSGVEFSCIFLGMSVHVLGYDCLLNSPVIANLCKRHGLRRTDRNQAILEKLRRLSMPIMDEELHAMGQHISAVPILRSSW